MKSNNKKRKKDEMMVLLENIEGKVTLVSEGHSILEKKIDNLDSKVDGLGVRIDKVEARIDGVELKMDRMEKKMDEGFKLVLDHLARLDKEFMDLKNEFRNNYEKKGHDAAWREKIEGRLEKLEKILASKKLAKV